MTWRDRLNFKSYTPGIVSGSVLLIELIFGTDYVNIQPVA
jgi:hypothetical protein